MINVYGLQNREIYKNAKITINRTMAFQNTKVRGAERWKDKHTLLMLQDTTLLSLCTAQ
jgi:hypothetical protein